MNVRTGLAASALLLASLLPVAPSLAAMTAQEAQIILFKSQDTDADGKVTPREFEAFRRQAMAAMDSDGDSRISRAEWNEFDPGFLNVATQTGRTMALMDAKDDVFSRYNVSGDAYLTNEEMMAGLFRDFLEADADDNGTLDPQEAASVRIIRAMAESLMQ